MIDTEQSINGVRRRTRLVKAASDYLIVRLVIGGRAPRFVVRRLSDIRMGTIYSAGAHSLRRPNGGSSFNKCLVVVCRRVQKADEAASGATMRRTRQQVLAVPPNNLKE